MAALCSNRSMQLSFDFVWALAAWAWLRCLRLLRGSWCLHGVELRGGSDLEALRKKAISTPSSLRRVRATTG